MVRITLEWAFVLPVVYEPNGWRGRERCHPTQACLLSQQTDDIVLPGARAALRRKLSVSGVAAAARLVVNRRGMNCIRLQHCCAVLFQTECSVRSGVAFGAMRR